MAIVRMSHSRIPRISENIPKSFRDKGGSILANTEPIAFLNGVRDVIVLLCDAVVFSLWSKLVLDGPSKMANRGVRCWSRAGVLQWSDTIGGYLFARSTQRSKPAILSDR